MMSLFAFVRMVLAHLVRDKSWLFFMLALPVAIMVVIGSTFGTEPRIRVGVVGDTAEPLTEAVVEEIASAAGYEVRRFDDVESLRAAIRRFEVAAGAVVPDGSSDALAAGSTVEVAVLGSPTSSQAAGARSVIERAVSRAGDPAAVNGFVREVVEVERGSVELAEVEQATAGIVVDRYEVEERDIGAAVLGGRSGFSLTAPQNLVLFVFINTLGSGALLIRFRRMGVLQRIVATPTSASTILAGLGAGWMSVALVQSVLIILVGWIGFGVDWGDPVAAVVLVVIFSAVGATTGLLLGAIGRNEDRAGSMTPVVGLVLGALGGCMMPLEVFPSAMAAIARITPHYWAMTSWQALIFDGASLGDVAVNLAVLVGFVVVVGGSAAMLLRRDLQG